ncbi:MAG: biotin/lipoyl-binding protein [Spirochaetota bacterium]|jgi:biotin carboxyl carrier protein|nr:biotin/lipoyl-binding protein [Spirochaetota bacterium]
MDKDTLDAIMAALDETSIAECEIVANDRAVRIVRAPHPAQTQHISAAAAPAYDAGESESDTVDVTAAHVGYFYRGAGKGAKPCAKIRDMVREGQQIGSINIMNVFQNVTSPVSGKLLEFLVEDGQPVEYGQSLARLLPEEQDRP